MSLHIAVCVKPVPNPADWKDMNLDPATKTVIRQDVPLVLNPLDKHALAAAKALKEELGGRVTVVSMAPLTAADALTEALARGADQAVLLSDPRFAGADTLATSYVLAAGLSQLGKIDLVLTGAASLDGGTAQVGPQLAVQLGMPYATQVVGLVMLDDQRLQVTTRTDEGEMVLAGRLPLVLTVAKELNQPRPVSLMDIVAARDRALRVLNASDLPVDMTRIGLTGSPTQMKDIFAPEQRRRGEILSGPPETAAEQLIADLKSLGLWPQG